MQIPKKVSQNLLLMIVEVSCCWKEANVPKSSSPSKKNQKRTWNNSVTYFVKQSSKGQGTASTLNLACSRLRDGGEKSFSKKNAKNARGFFSPPPPPFPSRARLIFALLVLIRPHYTIWEPGTGYPELSSKKCRIFILQSFSEAT